MKVAGVRFRNNWKIYDFDASGLELEVGDSVIVDSERGLGFASVVRLSEVDEMPPYLQPAEQAASAGEEEAEIEIDIDTAGTEPPQPKERPRAARKVLRRATEEDHKKEEYNRSKEGEVFALCRELISERELPMRLVRTEVSFDASRATFFFFSETRVDFRELVKELAHRLKMRIEMRQIGVRDVARLIGGFGPCGREFCCASFLRSFDPVSIRMAKKQELVLNPAKISGICGRLLCCLSYEYEIYDDIKKDVKDMRAAAEREKRDLEARRLEEERKEVERRQAEERMRREEQRRLEEADRSAKIERTLQERRKEGQPDKSKEKQVVQQHAQQVEKKEGKKKRRRFWRKKKKKDGQPAPQHPQG